MAYFSSVKPYVNRLPSALFSTFIHASEQLHQVFLSGVKLMLLPRVAVVAPQHNQLSLSAPHGTKVRDLYDHRTLEKKKQANTTQSEEMRRGNYCNS